MEQKIRFFRIQEREVRASVEILLDGRPQLNDKFSIRSTEDGDGFYLIMDESVEPEAIWQLGGIYRGLLSGIAVQNKKSHPADKL